MNAGKKRTLLLVTVVVLVPLIFGLAYTGMSGMPEGPSLSLEPGEVIGGQVVDLVLRVPTGTTSVGFSWSLLTFEDGGFSAKRNLTFTGHTLEFSAVVSPWVNYTHVKVEGDGLNHTFNLTVLPAENPMITGQGFYDYLHTLTQNYPHRQTGIREHYEAADWINGEFQALGYQSEIFHYRWSDRAAGAGQTNPFLPRPVSDILVICGWHPGEIDTEWIVIGAHFDNAVGNRQDGEGAYDDGSGTALTLELARALSTLETRRTFVFCAWGGEEEGLIGSDRFANNEIPQGTRVVFNLNLDMVGISYPNPFPLHQDIGADANPGFIDHPEIWEIVDNVTHEGMGWPRSEELLLIEESTGGGSDHTSFQGIGVPTVFNIGEYDYPHYHTSDDTLANMESYSGGKDKLVWAFDANAWLCLMELAYLDNTPAIT